MRSVHLAGVRLAIWRPRYQLVRSHHLSGVLSESFSDKINRFGEAGFVRWKDVADQKEHPTGGWQRGTVNTSVKVGGRGEASLAIMSRNHRYKGTKFYGCNYRWLHNSVGTNGQAKSGYW